VVVCLDLKGVAYRIDPIVPFLGGDRFAQLSPLRRIPVLVEDDLVLTDSSVICQYLEDRVPEPTLYPRDVADRARARWLEEFADTRLADVLIWRLFYQLVIRRFVWGEETDRALVARTLAEDVPEALGYLERVLPPDGFAFGALSIADVALACLFRTAEFARFTIDAGRWPRTAGLVARTLALEPFQRLRPYEDALVRTPLAEHRAVLGGMGAPLTAETVGTATPRRGVMPL